MQSFEHDTKVDSDGLRSIDVIESVCPINEHSMLLSCNDQYIMRSACTMLDDEKEVRLTMVVALASSENALVVVGKFDEVDAIALAVVGVDFFTTF